MSYPPRYGNQPPRPGAPMGNPQPRPTGPGQPQAGYNPNANLNQGMRAPPGGGMGNPGGYAQGQQPPQRPQRPYTGQTQPMQRNAGAPAPYATSQTPSQGLNQQFGNMSVGGAPPQSQRPQTGPPGQPRQQMRAPSGGPPGNQVQQKHAPAPAQMQPRGPSGPGQMQPRGPSGPAQMQPRGPSGPGQMQPRGPPGAGQMQPRGPSAPGQMQPRGPSAPGQMQPRGPGQMQARGPPGPGQMQPRGPGQMQPRGPSGPGQMQPGQMQPRGPPGAGQMQQPRGPSGPGQMQPGQMQPRGPPGAGQMQQPRGPGQMQTLGNIATTNIDPKSQCEARFCQATFNKFPNSAATADQSKIPLGAVLTPLADGEPVPVVNYGSIGVVRCKRCRAYMNPFVQWLQNGRQWQCNICDCLNDTNSQYFRHLDANHNRVDRMERPELHKGCVEIVAPSEYMVRPPQPPVYVFVIDVSHDAVASGMLRCVVDTIKQCLDKLPGAPRTQVGFITFDTSVHFYNLKSTLKQPQMMIVSDIQELFLPVPEELLVNLGESRAVVDQLLDSLPEIHTRATSAEAALGPALQAALTVMSHIGGKMCIFQTKLPTLGDGKLAYRENPRALGTVKEHELLEPANQYYKNKALELSRQQICVELFLFPHQYVDVATLNLLPKFTGGELHCYHAFSSERDGVALMKDVERSLTRETAWEAVMRVRASRGVRVTNFYGNFFLRGTDLLALPNCDADATFGVEFAHEEKKIVQGAITLQTALLYTNSSGERRIRVLTSCIPVTPNAVEVIENANQDALCNLMAKKRAANLGKGGLQDARRQIEQKCVEALRAYKQSQSYGGGYGMQPQQQQQQRQGLPNSLNLFPLYTMALQKNPTFRGGTDVSLDERAGLLHSVIRMSLPVSKVFIHPKMYVLSSMTPDCGRLVAIPESEKGKTEENTGYARLGEQRLKLPQFTHLSVRSLTSDGAFLLDNGIQLLLWVGRALRPDMLQSLFGLPSLDGIDSGLLRIVPGQADNDLKQRILNVITAIREQRTGGPFQKLTVIKEGEPLEARFRWYLVEDRAPFNGGSFAYDEYVNHVMQQAGAAYGRR